MADLGVKVISPEKDNATVFLTMLTFTVMMVTLPISFYFLSKSYVFESLCGMSSGDSYFYAAIVAVVTVHVVLALFIYTAWNEGNEPSPRTFKTD